MANLKSNKSFTDQMGRQLTLNTPPKRIISLVPSQTELLYDLGLREEVIGITKFCIHPKEWFNTKSRVGGTKKINFEKIKDLKPDLIIGNKEENEQSQIKELMKHYPVWMSDIKTLEDAYEMIVGVGEIVGRKPESEKLVGKIKKEFKGLEVGSRKSEEKKVMYFIWKGPYIVAGGNTFINNLLNVCGFENVFGPHPQPFCKGEGGSIRYLNVTIDQIKKSNSDFIFLSSEPYPFKEKHIAEFQSICPKAQVKLVDGEMFSWYGSRLLKAPEYFMELIKNLATNYSQS